MHFGDARRGAVRQCCSSLAVCSSGSLSFFLPPATRSGRVQAVQSGGRATDRCVLLRFGSSGRVSPNPAKQCGGDRGIHVCGRGGFNHAQLGVFGAQVTLADDAHPAVSTGHADSLSSTRAGRDRTRGGQDCTAAAAAVLHCDHAAGASCCVCACVSAPSRCVRVCFVALGGLLAHPNSFWSCEMSPPRAPQKGPPFHRRRGARTRVPCSSPVQRPRSCSTHRLLRRASPLAFFGPALSGRQTTPWASRRTSLLLLLLRASLLRPWALRD